MTHAAVRPRLLVAYVAIVFALAWAAQIVVISTVRDLESAAAVPWLVGAMFVPGLTALAFAARHPEVRPLLLWKPTFKALGMLPLAFLVPTAIAFAVVTLSETLGWGHSGWFTFSGRGVAIDGGPWLLGRGAQSWPLFVANVALTGAAFSLMNGLVAAGEELGWRGFLQGALTARLGTIRGIVLLGVLWSMWHLPAQLAGYNFPDHPVLGSLVLSPLELVGISLFLGWLTIRSRSFWPAAVAHGAGNSIQEGVTANLQLAVPRLTEDLATLAITALVGLVCWALLRARGQEPQVRG